MAKCAVILATLCVANLFFCASATNVFCYYDGGSQLRDSQGKMLPNDLESALSYCTHLIYGYAGIDAKTNKIIELNQNKDADHDSYKAVTEMKKRFPALKVLISVGGMADFEEKGSYKYITLLESSEARTSFINSALVFMKNYGFDGLDLSWQFPKTKPEKIRSAIGSVWHGLKQTFTGKSVVDEKSEEHKSLFSNLTLELKNAFAHDSYLLIASVLPNVNSTLYFDTSILKNNLDFVVLHGYDFKTAERNPKEADYPAPINEDYNRNSELNINYLVNYWKNNGFPTSKLILGISTRANAWKLDSDSDISGVPPLHADKTAPEGPYTKKAGILSYPEVCSQLPATDNKDQIQNQLKKVRDPSKKYGTYAFRAADDKGEKGIWIGYEDPDSAAAKATYASSNNLGGVAIVDLSMDDFRGLCAADKFPILRAVKAKL